MTECKCENTKIIGTFTIDCGCSGEYRWTRRRCSDCGKITMTKTRVDEEPDEKTDLIPPKKTRKKRRAPNSINDLVDKENP